jgi:cysteate synthase
MGKFTLKCLECGSDVGTDFNFSCPNHDALIRSHYYAKRIKFRDWPGIWRFYDWLPVKEIINYRGKSVTYRSENLAEELGLKELYISFNGYWPEREAMLMTSTFKELEAAVTIEYAREHKVERLVVASVGNTAKAFAYIASREGYPVVLVVPKKCICEFWATELEPSLVKTVVIEDGDYSDAMRIAKKISSLKGFTYEGGARNIARRDGLATILVEAVEKMGKVPNHYFQAVGSGTGGISAWEAALRLRGDGRFGRKLPKLHFAQNLPFAPMFKAWRERRREILPEKDIPKAKNILDLIYALVLSNKYPCYGIKGGIFDALLDTDGEMYGITNDEAMKASEFFESAEGIDILPAAAVAVASLIKAVEEGKVNSKDSILLNITGGGNNRVVEDFTPQEIETDVTVYKDVSLEELKEAVI